MRAECGQIRAQSAVSEACKTADIVVCLQRGGNTQVDCAFFASRVVFLRPGFQL